MNTKHSTNIPRKDAAITKRYGKIGIPAVAAAAPYGTKSQKKQLAGSRAEAKSMRGTSPRR
jgi:hypothetical protein